MRSAGVMADVVGLGASFSGSEAGAACAKANAGQQVTADSAARRTRENDIQELRDREVVRTARKGIARRGPALSRNCRADGLVWRSPLICDPVRERRSIKPSQQSLSGARYRDSCTRSAQLRFNANQRSNRNRSARAESRARA